jgi:hypothetical protein
MGREREKGLQGICVRAENFCVHWLPQGWVHCSGSISLYLQRFFFISLAGRQGGDATEEEDNEKGTRRSRYI